MFAQSKTLPMSFNNPGNRRILRTKAGNHFYFRSLPEKSMTLNTKGISEVSIRSFAIEPLRKPQIVIVINKERKVYDLSLAERLNGYYIYNPILVPVTGNAEQIEVICYERSIYMRAFYTVVRNPKPKKEIRKPNMNILAHAGLINLLHDGKSSEYHSFNKEQPLSFELNNGRNAVVYVRARLTDRSVPEFSVYKNGEPVETHEFTLKRTTKFKVEGVRHLSIGIKLELPKNEGSAKYELRANSDHIFFGRPVLLRVNN